MITSNDVKSAVKAAKLPDESRAKMAKRLKIPYVTLRRMEEFGLVHNNDILATGYMSKLTRARRKVAK